MFAFRSLSVIAALFAFWVVLSGFFTPFLLTMGLLSAIVVLWFGHRMEVVDHEGHPVHLGRGALLYWPWLAKEIVKSAWDVSLIIVNPRLPISPSLVRVKCTQQTPVGKVIYANSITLTPGTVSMQLSGDEILVHALTRAGADSLAEGDMDRRVTAFEGS